MAKKLLNEAAVRRFQSLANISPINEMSYKEEKEEDKMEEGLYETEEDEMKEYMSEQEGEEEMPPESDMEDMEGDMGEGMQLTEEEAEVLIELGKRLEAEMGGMADEEGEMPPEEGGMPEEGGEVLDEEDIMEALAGISYVPSNTEIVEEVATRVARRLKEAKLHEAKLNRALGRRR
jgi:hypothetical protein